MTELSCIVLAAGKGTRMKSDRPKVMHQIAGRPLVTHVLASVAEIGAREVALVIGPDMAEIAAEGEKVGLACKVAVQQERLGTGDAVRIGLMALPRPSGTVIVLFGDTPLITPGTIANLARHIEAGASIAVLGFETGRPTGYGRILRDAQGQVVAIREENDASPEEKAVTFCNSGVMAFNAEALRELLPLIGNDNAKGEYYLTDAVALAVERGMAVRAQTCDESEVQGINNRLELSRAETLMQVRLREAAMLAGVTMQAPETVFLTFDTQLAADVLIEPNVVFGPGVTVESGAVIHAFSHLEGTHVGAGCHVGPFARLRPGTRLGPKAKVGNFVETKNARVGERAKINHLSYVGDARVGENANIGAGTITCNYDGFDKHMTDIGAGAFIGSNSALVAPVTIADGAYVGSGSVVTRDVEAGALALARGVQVVKPGWATRFRAEKAAAKAKSANGAAGEAGEGRPAGDTLVKAGGQAD
ncbi:bifunctional UDP-N-acetylglucosamine diphosphorylase/glucosamine-1-phosphate N-acetyltransferase GlmU [Rhodoligotrophos defluvii]|uniref:bifunctional UDP-N-acetylglucosamine diphosphorylase/glucosamine-1-phosphate N-acetyltransferase GlmU n=1 Tax=Rhodoligotrophos defluvii TaxID=2561934 RepID=UPI0010C997DF|nr:bifunctional UDP-N-acetylglucosamine diphosphorylase/glucosamine-1-phosphate N-acetyltransferase GlmU [Rhodoligotrophos defluvii]